MPASRATVTPDGADACILKTVGGWSRPFLVWAAMLAADLTVLDPPELVADATAIARRLGAGPAA